MDDGSTSMTIIVLWIIFLVIYFYPTINALSRYHPLTAVIFVTNLFLGWTVIGWFASLALSLGRTHR